MSHRFYFRTISVIQFLNKVTTMTSIAEDLVMTPNCITQLRFFRFLFITLNGYSRHNDVAKFQSKNMFSNVDALGVGSVTILNKNFLNRRGRMTRRVGNF